LSCLLYCVFGAPGPPAPGPLEGVGGGPVFVLRHRGLGAALSTLAPGACPQDFGAVRAHGRVVAAFHAHRTVVPMRFGCLLAHESQVNRLLQEHVGHYRALLQELEGCAEMGIRLLLPAPSPAKPDGLTGPGGVPSPAGNGATAAAQGSAYLLARKSYYDQQDRESQGQRQIAAQCLAHFAGRFKKFRIENRCLGWPLLSLYFLVPRSSLDAFCQAFRTFSPAPGAKALLSGPWPPYNFVTDGPNFFREPAREQ